jgi:hypothetical protein
VAHNHVLDCRANRSPRSEVGRLHAVDDDTLRIRVAASDTDLAIPMASVADLWVVNGRHRNFWVGTGIGLLAGGLLGGAIGSRYELCAVFGQCQSATGIGILIGAPAGALLGGAVGALIQSDRWQPVLVPPVSIGVRPRLDGIGLRLSVAL